jgi:hypothetical protein
MMKLPDSAEEVKLTGPDLKNSNFFQSTSSSEDIDEVMRVISSQSSQQSE